mgnify:CR=1 FL=1
MAAPGDDVACVAAGSGDLATLQRLPARALTATGPDGLSPALWACLYGQLEALQWLVANGCPLTTAHSLPDGALNLPGYLFQRWYRLGRGRSSPP